MTDFDYADYASLAALIDKSACFNNSKDERKTNLAITSLHFSCVEDNEGLVMSLGRVLPYRSQSP